MVLSAEDILGKKVETPTLFSSLNLSPLEKKVHQALEREPLSVDEIARTINQNIVETSKIVSLMSLKGFITDTAGKYYLNS